MYKKSFVLIGIFSIILVLSLLGCSQASPTPVPPSTPPATTSAPAATASTPATSTPTTATSPSAPATSPAITTAIKPVNFSIVSFLPPNVPSVTEWQKLFCDKVTQLTNGAITFTVRGGPEVIAPNDLGSAVKSDAIDMGFIYYGAYEPLVPGIASMMLSQLTPQQERAPNVWNFIQQMHAKAGLYYLMRGGPTTGNYFYTWTNFSVTTPADLNGKLLGSAASGQPAIQAWGGKWVSVAVADNYTAMQRGEVEGIAGQPPDNVVQQKWYEVTKYCIDVPYYKSTIAIIMNLNKFNSLPAEVQKIINDTAASAEQELQTFDDQTEANDKVFLQQHGITFLKFSPTDAQTYVQEADNQAWALEQQRFPDITPQLKQLLTTPQ